MASLSGNIVFQAISAVIQIFGVPLCLVYWKQDYYGEWLLLFTIPGYLSVSDFGLGTSSTAEMAMMVEDQRHFEIQPLLKSVFWSIVLWGLIPFGILLLSNSFLPWYDWLKLKAIKIEEFYPTFSILVIYIYLSLFLTVPLNYYRVIKQYHVERYISAVYKVLEFCVLLILILRGKGVFAVALGYLLLRVGYFLFILVDLYRRSEYFRLWPIHIEVKEVRRILKPGISGLFFYLGGNMLSQGMSTVIGLNLGPRTLVMFNTVRMLTNLAKQIINIFNLAIYSEFSYAIGSKNFGLVQKLFRTSLVINVLLSFFTVLFLFLFGNMILSWWTKDVIIADPVYLGLYLLYTFLGSLSAVSITFLFATNTFKSTGWKYLLLITLTVMVNSIFIKTLGLNFMACTLIVFEILFIYTSGKTVLSVMQYHWKRLFADITLKDILYHRHV